MATEDSKCIILIHPHACISALLHHAEIEAHGYSPSSSDMFLTDYVHGRLFQACFSLITSMADSSQHDSH
ncbi:hypothetical protein BRADI_1g71383v3 [Brachypodium distachyon]|uniref:Uncharacterized protein n=1 Tax=Brachypodium distachyon TaxID=15368 RepID=A0A0Q3KF99_BRADI|nr:hypothetical protein BRADI_1g71383v3 [Brachypodium distachyon]